VQEPGLLYRNVVMEQDGMHRLIATSIA